MNGIFPEIASFQTIVQPFRFLRVRPTVCRLTCRRFMAGLPSFFGRIDIVLTAGSSSLSFFHSVVMAFHSDNRQRRRAALNT